MRRSRHHLPILVLFAGLGLANSALYYFIERNELQWGVEEALKGRAICLAGFYQPPGDDAREAARLQAAIERLSREAGGLDIVRYEDTGGGWVPTFLWEQKEVPTPGLPGAEVRAQLQSGQAVAQLITRPEADADILVAYAARPEGQGRLRVLYAVAAEERLLRAERGKILGRSAAFLLASLLAGWLLAELLARFFRRALAKLEDEAEALELTDRQEWEATRVTEFNDLTNTLKTIDSILRENVKQTWRRFFQAELLPRQEEIAADCQAFCDGAELPPALPVRVARRRLHRGSPDDFWGARGTARGWCLVAGRLAPPETPLTPLERIVRANAARDYILGALADEAIRAEAAWERLQALYPVLVGEQVWAEAAAAGGVRGLRHEAGVCGPVVTIDGAARRGALGTLPPDAMKLVREHLCRYEQQSLETVLATLEATLPPTDDGICILFEPKPPSP